MGVSYVPNQSTEAYPGGEILTGRGWIVAAETKVGGAGDGSGATTYSTVAAPGTVIAEIDGTEIGTGPTTGSKGKGKEVEATRVP